MKNRVSSQICIIFHRYGFTRIFGGSTSSITTLIDRFSREFSLPLIEVQSSSIQFGTICTLLTVTLIKLFRFGWIHDLTSKIRPNNALRCLSVRFYTLLYKAIMKSATRDFASQVLPFFNMHKGTRLLHKYAHHPWTWIPALWVQYLQLTGACSTLWSCVWVIICTIGNHTG